MQVKNLKGDILYIEIERDRELSDAHLFRTLQWSVIQQYNKICILDLHNVYMMKSYQVANILIFNDELRRYNIELRVINANPYVHKLLSFISEVTPFQYGNE